MGSKRKRNRGLSGGAKGAGQAYDEGMTYNPYLKAAILEVVENQIRDDNPPETRQMLERLMAAGYSRQEATKMIGSAVVEEIWAILHDNKEFDPVRYRAELDKLR